MAVQISTSGSPAKEVSEEEQTTGGPLGGERAGCPSPSAILFDAITAIVENKTDAGPESKRGADPSSPAVTATAPEAPVNNTNKTDAGPGFVSGGRRANSPSPTATAPAPEAPVNHTKKTEKPTVTAPAPEAPVNHTKKTETPTAASESSSSSFRSPSPSPFTSDPDRSDSDDHPDPHPHAHDHRKGRNSPMDDSSDSSFRPTTPELPRRGRFRAAGTKNRPALNRRSPDGTPEQEQNRDQRAKRMTRKSTRDLLASDAKRTLAREKRTWQLDRDDGRLSKAALVQREGDDEHEGRGGKRRKR
ncbi:hypothetical protein MMC07_006478 [Pseudocyphellaria aurata]|nr:hypothetical protein [Pseudocyphellaria aurata]